MNKDYYIVADGQQKGPFSVDELSLMHLNAATLVWRPGLNDWVKASQLPELADIITVVEEIDNPAPVPPCDTRSGVTYYAMIGDRRIGPLQLSELAAAGVLAATPVWCEGMADWMPASSRPEVMAVLQKTTAGNPYYDAMGNTRMQQPPYGAVPPQPAAPNNPYYTPNTPPQGGYNHGSYGNPGQQYQYGNNGTPAAPHTNWLPWAVVGTVVGTLFSCIGLVFGIIAIVQANKANTAFSLGDNFTGESANSSAKLMTIISFVLGFIGASATIGILVKGGLAASLL